ncbi:hypothetical protein AB0L13_41350 [Saccharopolyspora shandongensis]|uniref:hypothetical protein n=1 Tax=Saccharopolyspora shandongensis TaxID=418495 RepID=UPI003441525F
MPLPVELGITPFDQLEIVLDRMVGEPAGVGGTFDSGCPLGLQNSVIQAKIPSW